MDPGPGQIEVIVIPEIELEMIVDINGRRVDVGGDPQVLDPGGFGGPGPGQDFGP